MVSDHRDVASLLSSAYSAPHQGWSIWPCISSLTFSSPSPSLTSYGGFTALNKRTCLRAQRQMSTFWHWSPPGFKICCWGTNRHVHRGLDGGRAVGGRGGAHFHPWEGNISAASQPVPTNGTFAILKELCERKFYLHLQLYKLLIANVSIIFL